MGSVCGLAEGVALSSLPSCCMDSTPLTPLTPPSSGRPGEEEEERGRTIDSTGCHRMLPAVESGGREGEGGGGGRGGGGGSERQIKKKSLSLARSAQNWLSATCI